MGEVNLDRGGGGGDGGGGGYLFGSHSGGCTAEAAAGEKAIELIGG